MGYCSCLPRLPCLHSSDSESIDEREPLLSKDSPTIYDPGHTSSLTQRSQLEKVVDALAALRAGKLPSQQHISNWGRWLLTSDLLKPDQAVKGNSTFNDASGPLGDQGRQIISDIRELVEALLQFGLEKNVDDKLQEIYFGLTQASKQISSEQLNVNLDIPDALHTGVSVAQKAQEGITEVAGEVPDPSLIKFDAQTLLSDISIVVQTSLTSPIFRLLFVDLLAIFKEVIGHAAQDVEKVAEDVREAAKVVEDIAQVRIADESGDVIDIEDKQVRVDLENARLKAKQGLEGLREESKEIREEWFGTREQISTEAKDKLMLRLQQVLTKITQDPGSRLALQSILTLVSKYSQHAASISQAAADAVINVVNEVADATSDSQDGGDSAPKPEHVYPPTTPYTYGSGESGPNQILLDMKTLFERIAGGRSVDDLLSSFVSIAECVNEVPGVFVHEVEEKVEELVGDASDEKDSGLESGSGSMVEDEKTWDEEQPPADSGDKPAHPMSHKERRRLKHKTTSAPKATSASSDRHQELEGKDEKHTEDLTIPGNQGASRNPVHAYLSSLHSYFQTSIDEPSWITSDEGSDILRRLVNEGADLMSVVGQAVVEVGEANTDQQTGADVAANTHDPATEIKHRFHRCLTDLFVQLDLFVGAIQADRTTMRLIRCVESLRTDIDTLISLGQKSAAQAQNRAKSSLLGMNRLAFDWALYLIPKLLRALPSSFIPLPSVELKSGSLEVGLYASFVQGLARASSTAAAGIEPLRTSLVPDEIRIREWTEVKVGMADHSAGASSQVPRETDVQTTSRIAVHMDGIRAKLEGVGYYFKYGGPILGYQDEGLVSIDVGINEGVHEGIGLDFELEVGNGVGEREGGTGFRIPQVLVQDVNSGKSPKPTSIGRSDSIPTPSLSAAPPLFDVKALSLHLRSLHIAIDRSRHWILNKLLLQPLSGPVVAQLVEKVLEQKARDGLEALAKGLGVWSKAADDKANERVDDAKETGVIAHDNTWANSFSDWYGALLENAPQILGYNLHQDEGVDEEEPDGVEIPTTTTTGLHPTAKGVILTSKTTMDVPPGLVEGSDPQPSHTTSQPPKQPPMVFKKSTSSMEQVDMDKANGVEDQNARTLEPEPEVLNETLLAIGAQPQLFASKGGIDGYGTTSQQLDDEATAERQALLDSVQQGISTAVGVAKRGREQVGEGVSTAQRAERRFEERVEIEERRKANEVGGWRSDAFDF